MKTGMQWVKDASGDLERMESRLRMLNVLTLAMCATARQVSKTPVLTVVSGGVR